MEDKTIQERILAIQKKKHTLEVLKSTGKNGMTTLGYAWIQIGKPQLSLQAIRKTADWLVIPPQDLTMPALLERHQPKLFGFNGRPENIYLRTELGTSVLNEFLNEEIVSTPQIRDQWDLTHRYIILKVAELAKKEEQDIQIEHTLKNAAQEVRADLYAEINTVKIVLEVEQKLLRRNLGRARNKFKNWASYIQAEGTDFWRIYLVLNVRTRTLPTIIRYWQEALDEIRRELGELPYDIYYLSAKELLDAPAFIDALQNAKLLKDFEYKEERPTVFQGEEIQDADDEKPAYPDYISEDLYLRFQDALDTLLDAPPEKALEALSELAKLIYYASYYPNSPSLKVAVFPHESIWLMRLYLDHPRMAEVRKELATTLTRIQKRNSGMVMLRETVTSLLWDVLLFHHGLGRGGILRVVFQVPDFQDRTSDFQVDVRVDNDLRAARTNEVEALNWFFTSIYLYRRHLGLIEEKKK
jgi:hypothetical protein